MSVAVVAKKDFQDALRSRSLWALSAVFVLLAVLLAYGYAAFPEFFLGPGAGAGPGAAAGAGGAPAPAPTMLGLVFFLSGTVALFVSLTAIVVCYKSIAGEIELGSVKLLLALPHSRRDVVLGKVLGRGGVLALPALLGLLVGLVVGAILLGSFPALEVVVFLLVTGAFILTYVSIVVGLSAATSSTTRASTLAVGFVVVFELLWDVVPLGFVFVTNGFEMPTEIPDWYFLVSQLPPSTAYSTGLSAVLPETAQAATAAGGLADQFDALYATPWLGFLVLALWLVVPLAIGYRRFDAADL